MFSWKRLCGVQGANAELLVAILSPGEEALLEDGSQHQVKAELKREVKQVTSHDCASEPRNA